jgi:hypothetical protein
MPINMITPYANPPKVEDVGKVREDLKGKGQTVGSTNSHESARKSTYDTMLTPQAVGPAATVEISRHAMRAANPEEAVTGNTNKK